MQKYQRVAFEPIIDGNVQTDPKRRKIVLTQADIDTARGEGFAEGEQSAIAAAAKQSADALRSIAHMMQLLLGKLHSEATQLRTDALDVAMAAAFAIADAALAKCGEETIKQYLHDATKNLPDSAKIIVKTSPEIAASISEQLEQAAKDAGYDGKLVVKSDAETQNYDCAIEWQGGAISHNKAATIAAIEQAATEWLHAADSTEMQLDLFEP
ncbi:MAG: flagellar assembly protein FliH [Hyphomonadaceae bacterium]|nr:MAG: flagellar assembly protein FliH [Hyphomonadaceae bacterium]